MIQVTYNYNQTNDIEVKPVLTEEELDIMFKDGLKIMEKHIKKIKQEANLNKNLKKLDKDTIERIYLEARIVGIPYQKVADDYGVSKSTVHRIVHKKLPSYLKIVKEFIDRMNYISGK